MSQDFIFQRRIHLSGCASKDVSIASTAAVRGTREFISLLVKELLRKGANFVIPVDKNPTREADNEPICFDWIILETIVQNLALRQSKPTDSAVPLIVAVQHHKNEEQIPQQFRELWETLKQNIGLLVIENAGHWNMNSKRLEIQAQHGDVLVTFGGDEGVLHLANLYHESGKPVIPLNLPLTLDNRGSLKLWERALASSETERFFQTKAGISAHSMINRLNFSSQVPTSGRVSAVLDVLVNLRRPVAFAVRLLNKKHAQFKLVDDFFAGVVKPVVEDELGYELVTVDGTDNKEPFINQEIFNRLHRSSVVIVDVTGERPNCFIELGYALGRGLPTMVCALEGTDLPFDTKPIPTFPWTKEETLADKRCRFREYWKANSNRRRIVEPDPVIR